MKFSGVLEKSREDVNQKVIDVAQKAVAAIAKESISACHRLLIQNRDRKPSLKSL